MAEKLKTGPVKEFVFSEWLRDGVQGMRSKIECGLEKRGKIDTSEFRAHMRNARKEQLLAIRSLVDSALDSIKGEEQNQS